VSIRIGTLNIWGQKIWPKPTYGNSYTPAGFTMAAVTRPSIGNYGIQDGQFVSYTPTSGSLSGVTVSIYRGTNW
jgi:hypothetical protein